MALTYEEEKELEYLESLEKPSILLRPVIERTKALTDPEERELAELERMEQEWVMDATKATFKEFFGAAFKPVRRFFEVYGEERAAGAQLMREGKWWQKPIGALQYALSLPEAIITSTVAEPAGEAAKGLGVPEAGAGFAEELVREAAWSVPAGGLVGQLFRRGKTGLQAAHKMEQIGKIAKPKYVPFKKINSKTKPGVYVREFADMKLKYDGIQFGRPHFTPEAGVMAGRSFSAGKFGSIGELNNRIKEVERRFAVPKLTEEQIQALARGEDIAGISADLPKALKDAYKPSKLFYPKMRSEMVENIAKAAEETLTGNMDEAKRIFRQLGEKVDLGEIPIDDIVEGLPEMQKRWNLTARQTGELFRDSISSGARDLARLSHAKRRLNKLFASNPEALAEFNRAIGELPDVPISDMIMHKYRSLENVRRSILVSQVATAMRNAWSQAGRISIGTLDEMLQSALVGTVGGKGNTLREVETSINAFFQAFKHLPLKKRQRLMEILDANESFVTKTRLFGQPVHEVALGSQYAKLANTLNRTQEFYFRQLAFEAKLRQGLKKRGLDFELIDPKHIPQDLMEESVEHALEMTFAAPGKSKMVKEMVTAWGKIPGMYLVNPFPRFAFANALPFVFEHSPLGYCKAFGPRAMKELASGNPERFAKAASRATIGSLMLDSAMKIRQSDIGGEKWYEVRSGDRTIDLRAFAPLSTYLFIAEAIVHPERLTPADYAQGTISINRVAGTGLVLVDWIRARKGETVKQSMQRLAGEYIGSFTVTARTAKDIYGAIEPEEVIQRDVRDNPFIGPLMNNIPWVSQMLPEAVSPLETKRVGKEKSVDIRGVRIPVSVVRQTTGLSIKTKSLIRRETDKLNLNPRTIYPTTGVPKADRKIAEYMAPVIERIAPKLIYSPFYKSLSPAGRRVALAEMFRETKSYARRRLNKTHPKLSLLIVHKGMSTDIQKLIEEQSPVLKELILRGE